MDDGEIDATRQRAPGYDGEDVSPTTDRESTGWYSYGIAAEVFAVCGVGSFLPITLEQLAREHGVLRSDGTTPCLQATAGQDGTQCIVRPFGKDIATASFAMYTFSVAVFVQAIVLISFSAVADHGTYRKKFLLGFGFLGALSSTLFVLVQPSVYLLGALLVIIGVPCLGSSFVLLNSFSPLLARNHPSVTSTVELMDDTSADRSGVMSSSQDGMSSSAAAGSGSIPDQGISPELQLSNKISSKGVGTGYIAAVFVQCLSILLSVTLNKLTSSTGSLPMRLVLMLVGFWWAGFTIPCAMWLRDRPGPPLKTSNTGSGRLRQGVAYLVFSWVSVWRTIKTAIKSRQVVVFLIAWFLLSDAVATVSGTAILFARTELKMGTVPTAILSITATSSGIAGAFIWPIISRKWKLQTNRTIIACILLMEIIPLYGLIGFLPFIKRWGVGGLQQAWEIYPLGVVHGFVMGGLSSYCRSFYGQLIPPGKEAAFYASYAITDKGSSAIGPAIVGRIVDSLGTIRPAFGFSAVLIAMPLPLIWWVDARKGREDALSMQSSEARGWTDVHYEREGEDGEASLRRHED